MKQQFPDITTLKEAGLLEDDGTANVPADLLDWPSKVRDGALSSMDCESIKSLLASCVVPGGRKLNDLITATRKAIEAHRQEAYVTCEEMCWCWELDAAVTAQEALGHTSGNGEKEIAGKEGT